MCQKKGLPILPVRYAALAATRAHGIDGVPLVSGNFGMHVQDVANAKAKYTLRSLRSGFVYVYYPKTSKWQCYAVTNEGNCYDCPLDTVLDRSLEKPFSCTQTGHPELAQCITIDHADTVGTVFLAFSDVQWTKAVRDAYAADKDGCRTKRMQAFNASAWFASPGNATHAASATHVQQVVSEYKGGGTVPFMTSPFPWRDRSQEAAALNAAMDHLAPKKGAVFALWDPVGITQELNVENRFAYGVVQAKYQWGAWSASMVMNWQAVVEDGAVKDDSSAEQMLEGQIMENNAILSLFDGGKAMNSQLAQARASDQAGLKQVRDDSWEPYNDCVSVNAAGQYLKAMQKDFANEQNVTWLPLSQDYTKWLTSPNLAHVFQYDHDATDALSGMHYESTFTDCIAGASARKETFDQLTKWLQGKPDDQTNLLLRALCLNLTVNVNNLNSAAGFPVAELRETSAKAIESWFQAAKAVQGKAPKDFTTFYLRGARLVYEAGAPIAKVVAGGAESVAAKTAVLLAAARTGKVVVYRPVQGSQSQWITYFARQMYEMMPADKRPSMRTLKSQIRAQFTTKDANGRTTSVPQYIILDKDGLADVNKGAAGKATAQQVVNPANKLMLTDETIEAEFVPTFRKVTGGEVAGSAIGAVFTAINVMFAWKEFSKSTHFNSRETMLKFGTSLTTLAGGAAGFSGNLIESMHSAKLTLPKFLSKDLAENLGVAGRILGAPAAIVGAVYDFINFTEQWKAGHVGLAIAYFMSGILGFVLAVCLLLDIMASWLLPLTLLLIAIGLVIMWFKEREIKEFLGRSYFGKHEDGKYLSFAEEQKAYNGLGA
ncbi:T6SS effector BTH_I2691 family protein [Paraburkholderia sp. ZP32-5]|uniref:T6SS effector BTH_I2691 family protein n=1 Tax=Paraburkholderia sp. ZP32-5 TaxID=2883245 RepID=UPI002DD451AE|nr:T6SS effector BTH_I2691 family protein [Paraburkholderia sp. ZP32-5]